MRLEKECKSRHEAAAEWREAMLRFQFAGQVTLLIALLGWIGWFFPWNDLVDRSGTPLGGDYIMLYVAGQTVADGHASELYNDQRNQERTARLFPAMDPRESWPYRYPPTVAACMSWLSQLPFRWSFFLFAAGQLMLLTYGLWRLRSDYAVLREQPGWLWAIGGCPLVAEAIVGGQSSLLAFACIIGFLHYFRNHNNGMAGVLLALTLYKPNVAAILIVAAFIVRPALWIGFVPTAFVGVAISLATSGFAGLAEYLRLGSQLASTEWGLETPFWKVHGLAPFFQWLVPSHGKLLCATVGMGSGILVAIAWRRSQFSDNIAIAVLLCCNALFNPYVPIYDLVLLIVAVVAACEATRESRLGSDQRWPIAKCFSRPATFQLIAGLLFVGPHLSQAIAPVIGVQIFPIALSGLAVGGFVSPHFVWASRVRQTA